MLLTPTLERLRQENYYGFEVSLYHRIRSNGLEWDPVVAQAFGPSTPGRGMWSLSSRAAWSVDSRTAMATHLVSTHKTPPKIQNLMWNVLVIDKYTLKTWEITRTKHVHMPLFSSLSFKVKSLKMDTDWAWYSAEARDYHKFKSLSQKNIAEKEGWQCFHSLPYSVLLTQGRVFGWPEENGDFHSQALTVVGGWSLSVAMLSVC